MIKEYKTLTKEQTNIFLKAELIPPIENINKIQFRSTSNPDMLEVKISYIEKDEDGIETVKCVEMDIPQAIFKFVFKLEEDFDLDEFDEKMRFLENFN